MIARREGLLVYRCMVNYMIQSSTIKASAADNQCQLIKGTSCPRSKAAVSRATLATGLIVKETTYPKHKPEADRRAVLLDPPLLRDGSLRRVQDLRPSPEKTGRGRRARQVPQGRREHPPKHRDGIAAQQHQDGGDRCGTRDGHHIAPGRVEAARWWWSERECATDRSASAPGLRAFSTYIPLRSVSS